MQKLRSMAVRSLVAITTAASLSVVVGTTSASAAAPYDERYCTPASSPNNTDGVLTRSCWLLASQVYGDSRIEGYAPSVKMRIPSLDGTKWSRCAVNVAVFWKPSTASSYSRYQTDSWRTESPDGTDDQDELCLSHFRWQSGSGAVVYYHGRPVVIQPKACYYVITRWWGVYDGNSVGISASGPFPQSSTLCGPATGVDALDAGVAVPDLGEAPGGLITVGIE